MDFPNWPNEKKYKRFLQNDFFFNVHELQDPLELPSNSNSG